MLEEPTLIEELEPVFWNGGVTGRVAPDGAVVVEVAVPDPQPLTLVDLVPAYGI